MEILINAKNEYDFIPDIFGNGNLPDGQKFKIVMQKVNGTLHSGEWSSFDKDGNLLIQLHKKLKKHIVSFINPPKLRIGGIVRDLTIDDIIDEKFPELYELVNLLVEEMNRLDSERIDNRKK